MMRASCTALLILLVLSGPLAARLPRIESAEPAHAARDLAPGPREVRITFDQPINGELQYCAKEQFLPESVAPPEYPDDRTVVFHFDLQPRRTYRIQFHCTDADSFEPPPGVEPEQPVEYYITTGSAPGEFPTVDRKNLVAWQKFQDAFAKRYCYHDRIKMDWQAHFDAAEAWILGSATPAEFAQRLAILLEPAEDGHIIVIVPSAKLGIRTDDTPHTYNGNFASLEALLPSLVKHNENLWSAREGDIGYVMVGSMMNTGYQLDPLEEIMPSLQDCRAIIVDVRQNGGGLDSNAKNLASWFFDKPVRFGWMRQRHEKNPGGWSGLQDLVLSGRPAAEVYRGKVIILHGRMSASAAEWFTLMMENHENCVTVGDRTMGCSASPVSQDLGNGVYVNLPTFMALKPDKTDFEGVGLEPEVWVEGDFSNEDLVLKRGLELAREAPPMEALTPTPSPTRGRLQSWP